MELSFFPYAKLNNMELYRSSNPVQFHLEYGMVFAIMPWPIIDFRISIRYIQQIRRDGKLLGGGSIKIGMRPNKVPNFRISAPQN
jgi:hypothetical protein